MATYEIRSYETTSHPVAHDVEPCDLLPRERFAVWTGHGARTDFESGCFADAVFMLENDARAWADEHGGIVVAVTE